MLGILVDKNGIRDVPCMHIGGLSFKICLSQDFVKRQTRFVSRREPSVIIANIEAVATSMGFRAHTRNFKVSNSLYHLLLCVSSQTLYFNRFYV